MVQKGLRPVIPASCPAPLAAIMRECWARNPNERPSFEQLKARAAWAEFGCVLTCAGAAGSLAEILSSE